MRVLLIIGGILLMVAGIAGMAFSMFAGFGSGIQEAVSAAVEGPTAAELCKPGETLVEETGGSEYTPGVGYGRSVTYYCEDSEGNRRDVTGDFANDLIGDIGTSLMPSFNFRIEFIALVGIGLLILLVGIFSGLARRGSVDERPGMAVGPGTGVSVGGQPAALFGSDFASLAQRIQQSQPVSSAGGESLAEKLRQLDVARGANLITEDEYQRLRQQTLDSMQ
jgi:hypothetical protein